MAEELKVFTLILDKYGLGVAQIAIMVLLFWKLFTNHLSHIHRDIKGIKVVLKEHKDSLKKTNLKIDQIDTKQDQLGERVANIEGRLDCPKKKYKPAR